MNNQIEYCINKNEITHSYSPINCPKALINRTIYYIHINKYDEDNGYTVIHMI